MNHTRIITISLLLLTLPFIIPQAAAEPQETTHLLITMDTAWDYHNSGDAFVIRTVVKNVGANPALYIHVKLQNIPTDWDVRPHCRLIPLLTVGQTKSLFFIVTRGDHDSTVYATAEGLNTPLVASNHIPIPISPYVVVPLGILGGIVAISYYRRRQ